MQAFTQSGKPSVPKSRNQLKFEENIIILCAEAYTPLSIVEWTPFRRLIGNLDGPVTPKSRTRLTQKLIPKKYVRLKLLSEHSWLNSIAFFCLLIYGWLGWRITPPPPPPSPHNVCMEIQACAPWNAIFKSWNLWHQYKYSRFEINGGFCHSRKIHRVYNKWRIKFEDVSGCIGGKSYKHRNLPHTTNYVSSRLFRPCVTRCVQVSRFGLQVQGWRGHNFCVRCNGLKNSCKLCYMDKE